jgi:hypothetical protein
VDQLARLQQKQQLVLREGRRVGRRDRLERALEALVEVREGRAGLDRDEPELPGAHAEQVAGREGEADAGAHPHVVDGRRAGGRGVDQPPTALGPLAGRDPLEHRVVAADRAVVEEDLVARRPPDAQRSRRLEPEAGVLPRGRRNQPVLDHGRGRHVRGS